MTTSGTVGQTVIDVQGLIDHAIRRCGVIAEQITSEIQEIARENAYMMLSAWANRGIPLWCLDDIVVGFQADQYIYTLPVGTVDVTTVNYRMPVVANSGTITASTGTVASATDQNVSTFMQQSAPNGTVTLDSGSGLTQYITSIGILPYGNATYSLVLEWSTDGSTWNTLYTVGSASYTDMVWAYWNIDPGQNCRYYRIREAGGATLALREVQFIAGVREISMGRLNVDDYSQLPSKNFTTMLPPTFWFAKRLTPQIYVWGVPNSAFNQMAVWRQRHIQDVGALTNTLEVPQRWLQAVRDSLAWECLPEIPKADMTRAELLKTAAEASYREASDADRDKSPIYLSPNISYYTR